MWPPLGAHTVSHWPPIKKFGQLQEGQGLVLQLRVEESLVTAAALKVQDLGFEVLGLGFTTRFGVWGRGWRGAGVSRAVQRRACI